MRREFAILFKNQITNWQITFCKNNVSRRKNYDMIDWTKVTDNEEVIKLLKQREELEKKIRAIDEKALINYELEALQE